MFTAKSFPEKWFRVENPLHGPDIQSQHLIPSRIDFGFLISSAEKLWREAIIETLRRRKKFSRLKLFNFLKASFFDGKIHQVCERQPEVAARLSAVIASLWLLIVIELWSSGKVDELWITVNEVLKA